MSGSEEEPAEWARNEIERFRVEFGKQVRDARLVQGLSTENLSGLLNALGMTISSRAVWGSRSGEIRDLIASLAGFSLCVSYEDIAHLEAAGQRIAWADMGWRLLGGLVFLLDIRLDAMVYAAFGPRPKQPWEEESAGIDLYEPSADMTGDEKLFVYNLEEKYFGHKNATMEEADFETLLSYLEKDALQGNADDNTLRFLSLCNAFETCMLTQSQKDRLLPQIQVHFQGEDEAGKMVKCRALRLAQSLNSPQLVPEALVCREKYGPKPNESPREAARRAEYELDGFIWQAAKRYLEAMGRY